MKKASIGIDCGSVGVKLVLLDEEKEVVKKSYSRNRGIIDTLKIGFENIQDNNYEIKSVGVTGSGRNFVGMLIGADCIKTEILAHCMATLKYYPDVKTILDIGGEDCKILKVRNGILEDFAMNQICGAGTGSVIDSIANRMGYQIEEVGNLALKSKHPLNFPGKCGIFTQSSVVSRLNAGADKKDILMGVVNALVHNYLMLGKGIELKPPYVYQGATSRNKAIVKSLENQLKSEITVPKYAEYMGAIGAAILSQREKIEKTKFKGFSLIDKDYQTRTIIAKGCESECELTHLYDGKKYFGTIGNKCDTCIPKN